MNPPKIKVWYDDTCPFCVRQMRWLARLDWRKRLQLIPNRLFESSENTLQISAEALDKSIHCQRSDQGHERGARCLRYVGMRVPLLIPVALLMWIPGMIHLTEVAYQFISRHRYRISTWMGCGEACQSSTPPKPAKKA